MDGITKKVLIRKYGIDSLHSSKRAINGKTKTPKSKCTNQNEKNNKKCGLTISAWPYNPWRVS